MRNKYILLLVILILSISLFGCSSNGSSSPSPANTYTITPTAGVNGHIYPSGLTVVNYGGNQTVTISPNTGYHVADVQVDGTSIGTITSYIFNYITANHTINASFAVNTYTIVATAGANGTITPSGSTTVTYGATQTYTIRPNIDYHVADVLVDGSSVGALTSYTFTNVTANHSISASIAATPHSVTLNWAPNHERGVNSTGGGYQVLVNGQPMGNVPYMSGSTAPTSTTILLNSGTYMVTIHAYAALDAQGGSTGSLSASSTPITVNVP